MASVLDFLSQGTPPPAPTGTDTSVAAPLWLQDYLYSTLGAAQAAAGQPYTQFPGPTVASPSNATQQAWNMATNNVGSYLPYLNNAGALSTASAAPITSNDISTFLNPYQNYVTGALTQNLTENILPSIQDKFVASGQSRSPQEEELTARALRDTNTSIGQALAGGYQGAVNSLLQQRGLQGTAANTMGALGQYASQLGAMDVGQVSAAGSAQDQQAQANINAAMNQFTQQQQYPYQQLGFLSNIVRGLPTNQAGTTQQTVGTQYLSPQQYQLAGSPLTNFLGGVLGGNRLAQSSNSLLGFRRGGRVVHRRPVGALSRALAA